MKRKVIQLAEKTHVISLPINWIKKFNIKKGDELDLEEVGNTITIKQFKQETESKKIQTSAIDSNEKTLKYTLSALHKLGYDEITIKYGKEKIKNPLYEILPLFLGFTIVEHDDNKTVIKKISREEESELDASLRRAFRVIISLANSTLEIIKEEKFQNLINNIESETIVNQLTSYCLRLINKGLYKEKQKELFLVTVIWNLEKIADEYKSIIINLKENKEKINKDLLEAYEKINSFVNGYYELFYDYSTQKLSKLSEDKENITKSLNNIKVNSKYENQLIMKLSNIASKTSDLSSSIIALNYEKI
ncbi:AbrB/MazE/SpoVT family DNA-binding domain-containing protein [Candidatus Woesearchaeota archaeon]|nr:AbrB/MazE/SpoVT family DNA-binding domain-containing protein [Candidatus Woesearchaeota archaeon]